MQPCFWLTGVDAEFVARPLHCYFGLREPVSLIDRDLTGEELPLLTKLDIGNQILDRVKGLFKD